MRTAMLPSRHRWPAPGHPPRPGDLVRQVAVLALAAIVYFGGRVVVEGSREDSIANAERLLDIEAALGIDIERDVQQFALDHDVVRVLGNLSYVWLHWPLLIAVLWLLHRRDPAHYLQFRNAVFVSGLIGLVLFALVPMAPPRFMPGYVGTVSDAARRHYLAYPLGWTNPHAAFPSFHVGWTLIACLALAASLRHDAARLLAMVPAVLVAVSVISTGNHYVLDSLAGIAIAVGAYLLLAPRARAHRSAARGQDGTFGSDRLVPDPADSSSGGRAAPVARGVPMTLTPSDRDDALDIEVTVYEDTTVLQQARFATLGDAERFAEEWSERRPGVQWSIEDRTRDHTTWEAVETDTALDEDYPAGSEPE